jgi:hypothetical protein
MLSKNFLLVHQKIIKGLLSKAKRPDCARIFSCPGSVVVKHPTLSEFFRKKFSKNVPPKGDTALKKNWSAVETRVQIPAGV